MGSRKDYFPVVISKFLKSKLEELKTKFGENSWEYQSILKQYEFDALEDAELKENNNRHYEADTGIITIERLYKHHCCVEINFSCASHCRYCLRSNYDTHVISQEEIKLITDYVKDNNLSEILITGGDPFLSKNILYSLIKNLVLETEIQYIRIATRTFAQNPDLVTDELVEFLAEYNKQVHIEVATQIASPIELTWPETREAIKKITSKGIPVYSQNVFLKGINDTPEHLIWLYELMRECNITPHYLFNCCPLKHIHHFRPTLKTMMNCYEALVNSGSVTGRSKPLLALMTSIGKITLTPFNVIKYIEGEYVILRSNYKYSDRMKYNPNWRLPDEAWVDPDGYLCIKYLDGNDN